MVGYRGCPTLINAGADLTSINDLKDVSPFTHVNFQELYNYLKNIPRLAAELQKAIQNQNFSAVQTLVEQGAPIIDSEGNNVMYQVIGDYESKPTIHDEIARVLIHAIGNAGTKEV